MKKRADGYSSSVIRALLEKISPEEQERVDRQMLAEIENETKIKKNMDLKEIKFFKKEEDLGIAKATVHNTGKLGFNSIAAKLIGFEKSKFFQIGRKDGEDVLYMIPVDQNSEFAFSVLRVGTSWTVKVKRILMELGIDYTGSEGFIIFDIDEMIADGKKYYMLTMRKKKVEKDEEDSK